MWDSTRCLLDGRGVDEWVPILATSGRWASRRLGIGINNVRLTLVYDGVCVLGGVKMIETRTMRIEGDLDMITNSSVGSENRVVFKSRAIVDERFTDVVFTRIHIVGEPTDVHTSGNFAVLKTPGLESIGRQCHCEVALSEGSIVFTFVRTGKTSLVADDDNRRLLSFDCIEVMLLCHLKMAGGGGTRMGKLTFVEDNLPDDNATVKVLIRVMQGAGGIPRWLLDAYAREVGLSPDEIDNYQRLRYDPICLRLMRKFATEGIPMNPSSGHADEVYKDEWRAVRIPIACRDAFVITEYDGYESLHVDQGRILLRVLQGKDDDSSRASLKALDDIVTECKGLNVRMRCQAIE